jgi:hypothetical protein
MSCDCVANINLLNQSVSGLASNLIRVNDVYFSSLGGLSSNLYQNSVMSANVYTVLNYTSNIQRANVAIGAMYTNLLTVDASGNIGVMNGAPQTTVDVKGNVVIGGNLRGGVLGNIYRATSNGSGGFMGSSGYAFPTYGVPQRDYVSEATWRSQVSAANNTWNRVVWSSKAGLFCAVASSGSGNRVMTSPMGVTWTTQDTTGKDYSWSGLAWSNELSLFVAVASDGTSTASIMTSSDGITWTMQTAPNSNIWNDVCWSPELGIFVAVGSSGTGDRVMTSSNGTTWTAQTSAADNAWTSVIWISELGLFVAVASSGTGNRIMTSADAVTWVLRTNPIDNDLSGIAWSPALRKIVVGYVAHTSTDLTVSSDGVAWTTATNSFDQQWGAIAWAPEMGLFVAVDRGGTTSNSILYSSDAITWSRGTVQNTNALQAVAWAGDPGCFVTVATTGTGNRVNLSASAHEYAFQRYYQTFYGTTNINLDSNVFVADTGSGRLGIGTPTPSTGLDIRGNLNVGNSNYIGGNCALFTLNGTTVWSFDATTDGNLRLNSQSGNVMNFVGSGYYLANINTSSNIAYNYMCPVSHSGNVNAGGNMVIVGSIGNITIDSNSLKIDAVSNRVGVGIANPTCSLDVRGGNAVIYGNVTNVYRSNIYQINSYYQPIRGTGYAINFWGVPQISNVTSSAWGVWSAATDDTWNSVCWASQLGLFCAVASSGTGTRVMTSPDGVGWTTQTNSIDNDWTSVCWAPEIPLFCAVAKTGTLTRVMTSPDGVTWTTRTSATDNAWESICWSSQLQLFAVVASFGPNRIMISSNGTTWTSINAPFANSWNSVCWAPEVGLFCAVASSGTGNRVMTSPTGSSWTARTNSVDNAWTSVCWAPELRLFVAVASSGTGDRVMTSPDGITWTTRTSAADNGWTSVCWASELALFVAVASTTGTGNRIMTSPDGITWTTRTSPIDNDWKSVCWSPELGVFSAVATSGTSTRTMVSNSAWVYTDSLYTANIVGNLTVSNVGGPGSANTTNVLRVDATSNSVGILTNTPAFNLEVIGNAIKATSGAWITSSDARVKEEIEDANVEICKETFEKIPLRHFAWSNVTPESALDRHTLGWIAQEVKPYFPNAIHYGSRYGYPNFHFLNYDQLIKNMYGVLQRTIEKKKSLQAKVEEQETYFRSLGYLL